MMKRLRKLLGKIPPALVVVLMVVGFSAFHARRACDEIIHSEIAPPPRYSTRFVLFPSHHMGGAEDLAFRPGWVVTYAPQSREYGSAFFVSFFGKMLARGTPSIVSKQHKQNEMTLEKFHEGFAQLDAAVQVGGMFSTVRSVLGSPHVTLTNGFSLIVSNGIVVRKGYSYTSSR